MQDQEGLYHMPKKDIYQIANELILTKNFEYLS